MRCTSAKLADAPPIRRVAYVHHHFGVINSTMVAAAELLQESWAANHEAQDSARRPALMVTATEQSHGRGTHGRTWLSPVGNVYLTIAVSALDIPQWLRPVLPLTMGCAVRDAVQRFLEAQGAVTRVSMPPCVASTAVGDGAFAPCAKSQPATCAQIKLKWPNDLLVDGRKLGGMIIESCTSDGRGTNGSNRPGGPNQAFLIGVGVNVSHPRKDDCNSPMSFGASVIHADGGQGRPPTSLAQWWPRDEAAPSDEAALSLAKNITEAVLDEFAGEASTVDPQGIRRSAVVRRFADHADWDCLVYRRRDGTDRGRGPAVRPQRLTEWGHLVVVDPQTGVEEELCADYLL